MARIDDLTIQIRTEFKDEATPKIKSNIKALDEYSKSLNSFEKNFKSVSQLEGTPSLELEDKASLPLNESKKELKALDKQKANPSVSVKDKASTTVKQLETKMKSLNRTKATVTTSADDRAGSIIDRVKNKLLSLDGKSGEVFITAYDIATEKIASVKTKATDLIRKSWDMTVSVVDKATTPLRNIYNWVTSIQGIVTTWFAGEAFKKVVSDPVGLADFYTTSQTGFETMLGSAEKAKQMMDDINEFAIITPFKAQGLVDTSQKMLAMGWAAEDILPDLNDIGNAMAALGKGDEGIERVTLALSQMRAKGKVSAEEMNQLTEAGIGAWKYLSEAMGVSTAEAQDMVSKGLIPVEDAIRGIIGGMKEFDGFMKKTANDTVSGLLSQMEDAVSVNIFKPWGEGLKDGVQPGLTKINDLLSDTLQGSSAIQNSLKTTGEQLGSAVMGTAAQIAEGLANIVNSVEFKNASLSEKVGILMREGIEKPISRWWESGGKEKVTDIAKKGMEALGNIIKESLPVLLEAAFSNPVTGTLAMGWGLKLGGNLINGLTSNLTGGKQAISTTMNVFKGISNLKNVGFGGFTSAVKESGSLVSALKKIGSASSTAASGLSTVASSTGDLTSAFINTSKNSGGIVQAFLNMRGAGETATVATSGFGSTLSGMLPTLGIVGGVLAGVAGTVALYKANYQQSIAPMQDFIDKTNEIISSHDALIESYGKTVKSREEAMASATAEIGVSSAMIEDLYNLVTVEGETAQGKEKIKGLVDVLNQTVPSLNLAYDEQANQLSLTREEIDQYTESLKKQAEQEAAKDLMVEAYKEREKLQKDQIDLTNQLTEAEKTLKELEEEAAANRAGGMAGNNSGIYNRINEAKESVESLKTALEESNTAISGINQEINGYGDTIAGVTQTVEEETAKTTMSVQDMLSLLPSKGSEAGTQTGQNFATGIKESEEQATSAGNELANSAKDGLNSVDYQEEGRKSGNSWWEGVKSALSGFGAWIGSLLNTNSDVKAAGMAGNVKAHATGGIMDSPHIGLVAEDGPEAIIPLSSKRRDRGVRLWQQAGARLGIYPHAEGGISSGTDPEAPSGGVAVTGTITSQLANGFSATENETNTFSKNITSIIGSMNRDNINSDQQFMNSFEQMMSTVLTNGASGFAELENIVSTNLTNTESDVDASTENMLSAMTLSFLSQFPTVVQTGMTNSVTNVNNGMAQMIALLTSKLSTFNALGQSFMTELNSGINAKRQEILSSAEGLVSELKAKFEEGLGIHSPSRYMKWVGQMMMSGLIGGLSGSRLDAFISTMIGDMRTSFNNGSLDLNTLLDNYDPVIPDLIQKIVAVGGDDAEAMASTMAYPLIGTAGTQTSWFGYRDVAVGSTNHGGVDLAAPTGTPIAAALGGQVVLAQGSYGGYGNAVIIDHGNVGTLYGHMSKIETSVGQTVTAGQEIGLVGSTGVSTGPHLHFEVREGGAYGTKVDPQPYIEGASVLAGDPLVSAIQNAYNSRHGLGGSDSVSGNVGTWQGDATAEAIAPYIMQALQITGQSSSLLNGLMFAAKNESSYNPNAINTWDSNWLAGTPSKGLFQTIDSTFNAYKLAGYDNIWNPLDNTIAAIRYMIGRYGSVENVVNPRLGGWYGYATGTDYASPGLHWVGENGPELLQFRGGEKVFTNEESRKIAEGATKVTTVNGIPTAPVKEFKKTGSGNTNVDQSKSIQFGDIKIDIKVEASGNDGGDTVNKLKENIPAIVDQLLKQMSEKIDQVSDGVTFSGGLA